MGSNEPVRNECEVIYEMFHILNCGFEISGHLWVQTPFESERSLLSADNHNTHNSPRRFMKYKVFEEAFPRKLLLFFEAF